MRLTSDEGSDKPFCFARDLFLLLRELSGGSRRPIRSSVVLPSIAAAHVCVFAGGDTQAMFHGDDQLMTDY